MTPVTNMLLYSKLLCKEIALSPGGHKRFVLSWGPKPKRCNYSIIYTISTGETNTLLECFLVTFDVVKNIE